jgi:murein DD-endopeptidase MepM/ murein hydrolase activator NlpD
LGDPNRSVETKRERARVTRAGNRSAWALCSLAALVLVFLLAGKVAVETQTEDLGFSEDLALASRQNQELQSELVALGERLGQITQGLRNASGVQANARKVADIEPSSPTGGDLFNQEGRIRHMREGALGRELRAAAFLGSYTLGQARQVNQSYREILGAMKKNSDAWARIPSVRPLFCAPVTSRFGLRRDPFTRRPTRHYGVDLRAPYGAPVQSTADGRVTRAAWYRGYGRLVEMDHGNGIVTRYAHNSRLAVEPGDWVRRGQILAYVGSTGRANAPHLHFEVRVHGRPVNPEPYLVPDVSPAEMVEAVLTE